ncbi:MULTISPECIES: zeta toxin family protein [unclassified Mycolicibacterium]|uniref:zeta toxin family protein n=1 Tax=unclassified Mycolicibacterium TaxID=2636767 RepID=UPI001307386B|nr:MULTISPECIES: zeta toxin family protein [unclassified Mycolicibacterium]MUL81179.1 ZTL protein [Mycolicibacterium sp. CBMA 329]MUL86945.1 ZTL protein [Mycolicibacterium sp. CBMA 331]MUL98771.1 ZTL protein [Mycolicibacterium sp. CBMA 334]MUM25631.1 ZTL protein [Mycolicibacterium sp. CBMA 295]MUM37242.1 ZTL protein [Mycolicibacterium sp. CBMA 247]
MPCIYVLAGVNGAGKSSIGGAAIRSFGGDYFNPDEAARKLMAANPELDQTRANSLAWHQGKRLLERAIAEKLDLTIESTLGGSTIPRLLAQAAAEGFEVRIWFVGLASPELHIERVRHRVSTGGHDIPESSIRRRWRHSRQNLVQLLPVVTELRVYDNSAEADPAGERAPLPVLVLHVAHGEIVGPTDLSNTPDWAKPIVAAALKTG